MDPIRPGASTNAIGGEINRIRRAGPGNGIFSRAIVIDILIDPSTLTDEAIQAVAVGLSSDVSTVRRAPRNSAIVRPITGAGSSTTNNIICHPFFPPHFGMPVKAGEQVWMFFENEESSTSYGYWICRVTEADFFDDINYTHPDRRYDTYVDKVNINSLSSASGDVEESESEFDGSKDPGKNPGPPAFTNGPNDTSLTDPTIQSPGVDNTSDVNLYDSIYYGSVAMNSFVMEPVPRFSKRPGDLVLQGSNNAIICLGQDRGWNFENRPDEATNSNCTSAQRDDGFPPTFAGTVDIVAGRGRFYANSEPDPDSLEIQDTQPRVILNAREKLETDKNPAIYTNDSARGQINNNRSDRPQEGDPDFLTDASRIYVSMKTSGDLNFNITNDIINPPFEGDVEDIVDSPFIVLKSDEIRIVARKEEERDEINGSIRIIKEGTVGEDQASIYLLPDGVIQISGSKIYMGQADQGSGEGEAGSEPYVKYSELKALLETFFDDVDAFCDALIKHTTPGYGAPSVQITQGATELKAQALQRKNEIPNLMSERIFGE
jgi:hypothetical protein